MSTGKIVVANGFNRFHLMHAAAELERRGSLATCFTGFYPHEFWQSCLRTTRLGHVPRLSRLIDRGVSMPKSQVVSMPWIEGLNSLGAAVGSERLKKTARHVFAWQAAKQLRETEGSIFHYRSGFGHRATRMAKAKGMIALCDHSIAHPELVEYLVDHQGRFPLPHETPRLGCLWADIASDIRQADATLVCSDFVKDTFLQRGYDPSRLHVIYYGVDDNFLTCLDDLLATSQAAATGKTCLRLIFAGAISRRKGVSELAQALSGLSDVPWTLDLVGPIDDDIRSSHASFLTDPRVTLSGVLSRRDLASHLLNADALLFPSLAEGSARIVFDALAAGCYVITTKNAGSIVRNDVHGTLIAPGDIRAIQNAVHRAAAQREMVAVIGRQNAQEMRRDWRQSQYGEKLLALYERLLSVGQLTPPHSPLAEPHDHAMAIAAN